MGRNDKASRATIELVPESEATQVTVTHDEWAEDDPNYAALRGWVAADSFAFEDFDRDREDF